MFISKSEKHEINFRLATLEAALDTIRIEQRRIDEKLSLSLAQAEEKKAARKARSAEFRAQQSQRMKAAWAEKKAKQAAE